MKNKIILAVISFLCAICYAGILSAQQTVDVLIDKVHANDYSERGLKPDEYNYHRVFGFSFAFDYLKYKGLNIVKHTEGRLSADKLQQCRILFINLVSAERPPFYVSEITAIVDFVKSGGSLFIITEHSNAYFHSHRLAPLLNELDIASSTETLCEVQPLAVGNGNGWLLLKDFTEHPVTKGLRHIHFQTGGTVDDRFAVIRSSENSWADQWATTDFGESNGMGFYGNWKKDENERTGPLGAVLAKEYGKGRIVIAGDQNMFGDVCLDYADNRQLWQNIFAYLLQTDKLQAAENPVWKNIDSQEEYRKFRNPKILLAEDFSLGIWGSDEKAGCYYLRSALARMTPVFTDDKYDDSYQLVILPCGQIEMNETVKSLLIKHLQSGKDVLCFHTAENVCSEPDAVITQVLNDIKVDAPDLEILDADTGIIRTGKSNGKSRGNIHFVLPSLILLNNVLPPPEKEPDIWQKEVIEKLNRIMKNRGY
ncbi:hypothetical protein FACS18942_06350 [Planctomycetales bacterium]|nr:hypothetical protein FACS18942_06350 [Planctomycetales bacterium]